MIKSNLWWQGDIEVESRDSGTNWSTATYPLLVFRGHFIGSPAGEQYKRAEFRRTVCREPRHQKRIFFRRTHPTTVQSYPMLALPGALNSETALGISRKCKIWERHLRLLFAYGDRNCFLAQGASPPPITDNIQPTIKFYKLGRQRFLLLPLDPSIQALLM